MTWEARPAGSGEEGGERQPLLSRASVPPAGCVGAATTLLTSLERTKIKCIETQLFSHASHVSAPLMSSKWLVSRPGGSRGEHPAH